MQCADVTPNCLWYQQIRLIVPACGRDGLGIGAAAFLTSSFVNCLGAILIGVGVVEVAWFAFSDWLGIIRVNEPASRLMHVRVCVRINCCVFIAIVRISAVLVACCANYCLS